MKTENIEQLEHDIEITYAFLHSDLTMEQWGYYVSKYHALCIKLCQVKGERPTSGHGKSDYIIGN